MYEAGDANLIDHLGQLARTGRAHQRHGAAKTLGHGLDGFEHRFFTAAHDGQRAIDGASLSAGHGRIHEIQAQALGLRVEFAGHIGRRGGVVDEHGARSHARKCTVGPQHNAAQVVVVAHAGEDDLGTCHRFARRAGMAAAELGDPGLSLGGRAVVDRHVVPGAGQMAGHGQAHDTQAEESDFLGYDRVVALGTDRCHAGDSALER
ncbi:hypothetical protein D3C73_1223770 [compost metagenome]